MTSYDGPTHYYWWRYGAITVMVVTLLVAVILVCSGLIQHVWQVLVWVNINYFITRWIDPDLDQIGMTSADNRMVRELKIIGLVFAFYWTVYAFLIFAIVWMLGRAHPWYQGHRSFLSHSYLGTFGRIIWFNIPVYKTLEIFSIMPYDWTVIQYLIGQVIAFVIADTIHYLVDKRRLPLINRR